MNQMKLFVLPFLLLSLFMIVKPLAAQQPSGIHFFYGTYEEALEAAEDENKLVFVDAYTVWCGPCRWMSSNVFTNEYVGAFFNKHFINVKMDVERDDGPVFASRYGVRAYPTLLFIDSNGEEVERHLGAMKADGFFRWGQAVLPETEEEQISKAPSYKPLGDSEN